MYALNLIKPGGTREDEPIRGGTRRAGCCGIRSRRSCKDALSNLFSTGGDNGFLDRFCYSI